MTVAEINDFKDQYNLRFSESLEVAVSLMPQYTAQPDAFVRFINVLIDNYIYDINPLYDYGALTDWEKSQVREAELEQAYYVVHGVDFARYTGFNPVTGALNDLGQAIERMVCILSKQILTRSGLLYERRGVPFGGAV